MTPQLWLLATATAEHAGKHAHMDLAATVEFMLTGGVVVYGTLTLLALLGTVGGRFFVWLERRLGGVDESALQSEEPRAQLPQTEEDARIVAVISAAVTQVVDGPFRVVSFKQVGPNSWSLEGRAQHHASHKIR